MALNRCELSGGASWAAVRLRDAAVMPRRLIPSAHEVCVFAGLCYGSSFVKTNQSQWPRKHTHTHTATG